MDLLALIVWAAIAAVPLAVLSGWLLGPGERPLGSLLHGRDVWWRSTMPWPAGVQEEDDVGWHVPIAGEPPADTDLEEAAESTAGRVDPEPVDPTVGIRIN